MTAEGRHEHHEFLGPMSGCSRCQRGMRRCRGKVSYPDPITATEAAKTVNAERSWKGAALPYLCVYCERYHLATARGKHQLRRAERWRRKALRIDGASDDAFG